jgi:hypothetical protein
MKFSERTSRHTDPNPFNTNSGFNDKVSRKQIQLFPTRLHLMVISTSGIIVCKIPFVPQRALIGKVRPHNN